MSDLEKNAQLHSPLEPLAQHELPYSSSLYPNRWAKLREYIREAMAEFFGTMILVIFGTGVNCQVTLSSVQAVASSQKGQYLSVSFGWAVGVALGVWICGGISGGHINPAVTLSLAVFRGFPWRKVPVFIFAQILGAMCGSGIIYANYFHAIDLFEGGGGIRTLSTASLFATYALPYMTSVSCFFSEFIATAILLMVIMAVTDKKNGPPSAGLVPLALFITILGICASLGMETSFAINPARDFGPRIFTAMVYGRQVFNFRNQYWLWCPIMATCSGGLTGTFLYDAFLYVGAESIISTPNETARNQHLHTPPEQRFGNPGEIAEV